MSAAVHKVQNDNEAIILEVPCILVDTPFSYDINYFLLLQVLLTKWDDNRLEDGVKINIRLHNHPETMIALKNLKSAYIGNS